MKLFKQIDIMFDNFDESIQTFLSKSFNNLGLQYTNTQIFGIIFNGIKGIMQNILFYIEDAITEQNVNTATRRQSIYSLAKLSGFEASYGTSAGGILIAKQHLNNVINKTKNNIYIKNHSIVSNSVTGVKYSLILPTNYYVININNPLIEYQLQIQQGSFITSKYVAEGNDLETIHINSITAFDRQFISVKVDGIEYNEAACLYDMSEDSEEYVINIGFDNTFDIMFGNGIYGKKLKDGQVIEVEYLQHEGKLGNISTDEKYEFRFYDKGVDTIGNSIDLNDYLYLDVNSFISGGNDADSIQFIRNMIGYNSRSLIYSSVDNMKLFLKRFSFIGYNNCFSSLKNNKIYIIALQNTKHDDFKSYYEMVNDNNLLLTNDQKNMVISTLSNSKRVITGFNIEFLEPIIRKYAIVCYVKTESEYSKELIKEIINKSIYNFFSKLEYSVKFIAKSDIINFILENDEDSLIKSLNISFISEYNETSYFNGTYYEYLSDTDFFNNNMTLSNYNINNTPGLDVFGNISLNSIIEIPILAGNFKYYFNKTSNSLISSNDYKFIEPIEINFV